MKKVTVVTDSSATVPVDLARELKIHMPPRLSGTLNAANTASR